jgi:hypothetical protein
MFLREGGASDADAPRRCMISLLISSNSQPTSAKGAQGGETPIIVDFQMGEIRAIPATTLGGRDAAQDHSYLLQVDSDWLVLVAAAVGDKNFC